MKTLRLERLPIFTIGIVIINACIFFFMEVMSGGIDSLYMLEHGALFLPKVIEEKEYYRLFTACFLHFDFRHLMNNMFMLAIAGSLLERAIGHVKYICLYVLSGLGGAFLTAFVRILDMEESGSVIAGASGAVFGVIGGLLIVSVRTRGTYRDLSMRNMLIMILLTIVFGFNTESVDGWGHLGGLLMGILVGVPLVWSSKRLDLSAENRSEY